MKDRLDQFNNKWWLSRSFDKYLKKWNKVIK